MYINDNDRIEEADNSLHKFALYRTLKNTNPIGGLNAEIFNTILITIKIILEFF